MQVRGWKFYTSAVKTLFDADNSRADIRSAALHDTRKWKPRNETSQHADIVAAEIIILLITGPSRCSMTGRFRWTGAW